MHRLVLSAAVVIAVMMAPSTHAAPTGKVPGLHIYPSPPPGYGHPRVPRVVRGFNAKQQVHAPKDDFDLAPRR